MVRTYLFHDRTCAKTKKDEIVANEFGVNEVADRLAKKLAAYIEAQYHISNTGVIAERHALLQESGSIGQSPYVETAPSYEQGAPYSKLKVPSVISSAFTEFAAWNVGIFPKPFVHQAIALEQFFGSGLDLVVATGTGSGKTETFLMPILGSLLIEAHKGKSFNRFGARALLLYPMNALVSDQVARLRRLFGDERMGAFFKEKYGRIPRFGMYTSRTPYPGSRSSDKDQRHVAPLLKYFMSIEDPDPALPKNERDLLLKLRDELKARGRWPSKDLRAFLGKKGSKWSDRLNTQTDDRELLLRHEMQLQCPDILVTNYSMLEYMLIRPIERPLFRQTKEWLLADSSNRFLIVLDEAHMYRGVGGAEVALLLRRLLSRLEIPRERCRFILTSASLGQTDKALEAMKEFACRLTGGKSKECFAIIRGKPETRPPARPGTAKEAELLASVPLSQFLRHSYDLASSISSLAELASGLGWGSLAKITSKEELQHFLFERLFGFGPIEMLIKTVSGRATQFSELATTLFPDTESRSALDATSALLSLGTFAHNGDKPLLPARVHLIFRGLPTLYACCNPNCDRRLADEAASAPIGALYTAPRTVCDCKDESRVYELLTHRDCGAAFLRVYGRGQNASFYWHEQGGDVGDSGAPLDETYLLVEKCHPNMLAQVEPIYLDIKTGLVFSAPPDHSNRYAQFYRPSQPEIIEEHGRKRFQFKNCPVCTKTMGSKLMDLATKGEQPFAALTSEQLFLQPIVRPECKDYPNGGRKVLLFSDGRQKAARLARDLPREVERDSFRHAIILAARRLEKVLGQALLDNNLYTAFLSVCSDFNLSFFDHVSRSQEKLLEDIRKFEKNYDADLALALDDPAPTPPPRFQQALLRQLSDPFYSLYSVCAAFVKPRSNQRKQIRNQLSDLPSSFLDHELETITEHWIQDLLGETAFDPSLNEEARRLVNQFFNPVPPHKKTHTEKVCRDISGLPAAQCDAVFKTFFDVLTEQVEAGVYLRPGFLNLVIAVDTCWYRCETCRIVHHALISGKCPSCGASSVETMAATHPYMQARKGYFRTPIEAVLKGAAPKHLTAEEHTAQLSHRDSAVSHATTEEYELRFQDVPLSGKPPVDVLSCTTTMEVGIDIGSLTAVGMRNVPPQRENYQQRAGRAGRRGSSISTVITYAQGGPHDNFYYEHPAGIISGEPREPRIKTDNRRLAIRHVQASAIQRFFHETLDALPPTRRLAIEQTRTGIMSALGTARDFFNTSDEFSFAEFKNWIAKHHDSLVGQMASWLPDELFPGEESQLPKKKADFTESTLADFIGCLASIEPKWAKPRDPASQEEDPELLDVLFDQGWLPSYAFPTDLCTFFVFDMESEDGRIKEKPQQDKAKALSEYAPGRLLVVDKQTYRVGGVYDEGQSVINPAEQLFASALPIYVYCPHCTYVREEKLLTPGETCPVCHTELADRQMLNPPGFSPERGIPIPENDKDQEYSYATGAQLPTPVRPDTFHWIDGAGKQLVHAYEENRKLVVVNKGPNDTGFVICEKCGAIGPGADGVEPKHYRPYRIPQWAQKKVNISYRCSGPLRQGVYLGYSFRTDLLLLRETLAPPMNNSPRNPWYLDALTTAAEALAIGASRYLDIDPGEISANYRLMPAEKDESVVEFYLYDTTSGGAGYAAEAGSVISDVLNYTIAVLNDCKCEASCTKCLRHYGNRFIHYRLNRKLAMAVLKYGVTGALPIPATVTQQASELVPFRNYLDFMGWHTQVNSVIDGIAIPLLAKHEDASVAIAVGTYPALLDKNSEMFAHPLHALDGRDDVRAVLLRDYVVVRDLPTAYRLMLSEAGVGVE